MEMCLDGGSANTSTISTSFQQRQMELIAEVLGKRDVAERRGIPALTVKTEPRDYSFIFPCSVVSAPPALVDSPTASAVISPAYVADSDLCWHMQMHMNSPSRSSSVTGADHLWENSFAPCHLQQSEDVCLSETFIGDVEWGSAVGGTGSISSCAYTIEEVANKLSSHSSKKYSYDVNRNISQASAQSMAARQRRVRIRERLRKLEKMIPLGGSKFDTAGMLEEAIKYVKMLQAQVHVLEHMPSISPSRLRLLNVLLSSSQIQGKLLESQKCISPIEHVNPLLNAGSPLKPVSMAAERSF